MKTESQHLTYTTSINAPNYLLTDELECNQQGCYLATSKDSCLSNIMTVPYPNVSTVASLPRAPRAEIRADWENAREIVSSTFHLMER